MRLAAVTLPFGLAGRQSRVSHVAFRWHFHFVPMDDLEFTTTSLFADRLHHCNPGYSVYETRSHTGFSISVLKTALSSIIVSPFFCGDYPRFWVKLG